MICRMSNPHETKGRCYVSHMIDINDDDDLYIIPKAKASDKIGETELNVIILNNMTNGCSKQS